jgi:hypothetical protein
MEAEAVSGRFGVLVRDLDADGKVWTFPNSRIFLQAQHIHVCCRLDTKKQMSAPELAKNGCG